MRCAPLLLPALATLALAGCGGDDGSDLADLGSRAQPTERVAGPSLAAVDFAAVREQLGLPEDAGFEPDREHPRESIVLSSLGGQTLPFVRTFVQQLRTTPMFEAFDGGAITAAAGPIYGPEGTHLLHTTQPFDEIADALADGGFEEADGVLTGPEIPDAEDGPTWSVVDAGDGVVVIAATPEAARAAADDEGDETRREAFEAVDQPVRYAGVPSPDDAEDCTLRFLVVGQDARPADGEVVLQPIDGDRRTIPIEEEDEVPPGAGPDFTRVFMEEIGSDERVCP